VSARVIALYPKVHMQAELGSRMVDVATEGDVAIRGEIGKHKDTSLMRGSGVKRLVPRRKINLYASRIFRSPETAEPRHSASPF
jgi:hypothetical protein